MKDNKRLLIKDLIEFHLARLRLRVPRAIISRAVASMKQDKALPSLSPACTIDLWIHISILHAGPFNMTTVGHPQL